MKFTFLIYSWFPHGGQQRDFLAIVRECLRRGHAVDIHAWRWQGAVPEGVNLVEAPIRALSRVTLYRRFSQWVAPRLADRAAGTVVGFAKMPQLDVYFAADPCYAEYKGASSGLWFRLTRRYRHFRHYEQAVFGKDSHTEVLILSPRQRRDYEKHYPHCAARLHEIPPGIAADRRVHERDPERRRTFRREFGIASDDKLVLQIGSGFRIKGVDRSLRAIAALPREMRERTRFMLVGSGKPRPFQRLAKRLGLQSQVSILPGRDDVPEFLVGADLMLHPAYVESAACVLLEATIAGLPVLTTASCGYAFHIERAGSGEVCSEPFRQEELNSRLANMLGRLDSAPWSANGLAYGRRADLYSQPSAAVDLIERVAARKG